MLIKNASALLGGDLRYAPRASMLVGGGRFLGVRAGPPPGSWAGGAGGGAGRGEGEAVDCEGLLVIPGLVNCHTHVGDSIGKDVTLNSSADGRIHPVSGAKSRILSLTGPAHLAAFMRGTCRSMIRKGITTFVDFRENGPGGARLLRRAVSRLPIRAVVLGRIDQYHTPAQIAADEGFPVSRAGEVEELLGECDGLGISGANENSSAQLGFYSRRGGLRAIHAAETLQSVAASRRVTGRSEVARALEARPHFVVHMTHADRRELGMAARRTRGVVVCPRANASLAGGVPDIGLMQRAGCTLAIGTDNVMVNSPDMFREMDYLWKATMGVWRRRVDPKDILRMATVNAGSILRMGVGVIGRGRLADAVFLDKHAIDLEPMHSPHASVVHRASETAVRAVMVGGRIVHGRI